MTARTLWWGMAAIGLIAASASAEPQKTAADFVCSLGGECGDGGENAGATGTPPAPSRSRRVSPTRGGSLIPADEPAATPASKPKAKASASAGPSKPRPPVPSKAPRTPGRDDLSIAFANGSSELSLEAREQALAFAEALGNAALADKRFVIEGHTNAVGSRAYNLDLSQRRAQAVVDYLVARGADRGRFEVKGYGFDRPLAGRRAASPDNRRVEVAVIS